MFLIGKYIAQSNNTEWIENLFLNNKNNKRFSNIFYAPEKKNN